MTDAVLISLATAAPLIIASIATLVTSVMNGRKVDDARKKVDDANKKIDGANNKIDGNEKKIEQLHILINSRLTQLLEQTATASRAQGVVSGIAEGAAQRDVIAQAVKDSHAAGVLEGGAIVTAGIAQNVAKTVIEDVVPAIKNKNPV